MDHALQMHAELTEFPNRSPSIENGIMYSVPGVSQKNHGLFSQPVKV
jgi:hypothetical protein